MDLIFACSYPSVCPGILYPFKWAPIRIHPFRSGLKICILFQYTSYLFIGLTILTDANCHWVFVSHVPKSQLSHLKMLHLTRSLRMLHFVGYARHCYSMGLEPKCNCGIGNLLNQLFGKPRIACIVLFLKFSFLGLLTIPFLILIKNTCFMLKLYGNSSFNIIFLTSNSKVCYVDI